MRIAHLEPSVSDLQRAFESSGLERNGWDFDKAMKDPSVSWGLKHRARDYARRGGEAIARGGHADRPWNGATCHARQQGDQMCCGKCGKQWDVNDPEPPECGGV